MLILFNTDFYIKLHFKLKKRKINVTFNKLEEIWKTWKKLKRKVATLCVSIILNTPNKTIIYILIID